MSDEYAVGQRIGAAGNQAATVLQGSWRAIADGTATAKQIAEIYGDLVAEFAEAMATVQAAYGISEAFPGTTVATQQEWTQQQAAPEHQQAPQAFQPQQPGPFGGGNVVPFPQQQQQAFPQQQGQNFQPAPVPGGQPSKTDQDWMALFNNPGSFYDNRNNKRSTGSPDFKQKQGDVALWLNGKFGPAPQWVFDRLQGGQGPVQ
jgi:hypothetical protein